MFSFCLYCLLYEILYAENPEAEINCIFLMEFNFDFLSRRTQKEGWISPYGGLL